MPKVSVLTPSYNHEDYFAGMIESVLNQTFEDFEFVILDDASNDRTLEIAKEYARKDSRITVMGVNEENLGAQLTANLLIKEAKGDYLTCFSSDDEMMPDRLEKQVVLLDEVPDVAVCFTDAELMDGLGNTFTDRHVYHGMFSMPNIPRHEWIRFFFWNGNVLCQISALSRTNLRHLYMCDPRFRQLPDWDRWQRVLKHYDIHIIDEKLVRLRLHPETTSRNTSDVRSRQTWEHVVLLRKNYLNLSTEEFKKIFPDYPKMFEKLNGWECEIVEGSVPFHLAYMALFRNSKEHVMFAIPILYNLLGDPEKVEMLEENYGFTYNSLYDITGKYFVRGVDGTRD